MAAVTIEADRILFGEGLAVSFHRTLRVPEDGRTYPLPAGLGRFPILRSVRGAAGCLVLPMHGREAMWIGFSGAAWRPHAVKVVAGGINAVTGEAEEPVGEPGAPQDYLVCPLQPWLDGFNAGAGRTRQFVAMPLGEGYGIAAGHGLAESPLLQVVTFAPRPGRFPDEPPPAPPGPMRLSAPRQASRMAISAGGAIGQKLYADPHGPGTWEPEAIGRVELLLIDARRAAELTGAPAPPSPVDAAAYAAAGLPWFDLDDAAAPALDPRRAVPRTVAGRDRELGRAPEPPAPAPSAPVTLRRRPPTGGPDGEDDG